MDARRVRWWGLGASAAAVAAVHARALGNAPLLDDLPLATKNPFLRGLGGLAALWTHDLFAASGKGEPSEYYRPVGTTSLWLNRLAGGSATAFHAGNVALHVATFVLLAWLAERLLSTRREGPPGLAATGGALLFALAPLATEAVAWIAGRFDLLATTLVVLTAALHARRGARATALTVAAFAAALGTKEVAVVAPLLLLLEEALLLGGVRRASLPRYAAMIAVVGAYAALRAALGIHAPPLGVPLGTLVAGGAGVAARFLRLAVAPTDLDPFAEWSPPSLALVGAQLALLVALTLAALALVRRRPASRPARLACFGWLWLLVALVPAAPVWPALGSVGDRYAYLPLVGLALVAAAAIDAVASRSLAALQASVALVALASAAEALGTVRRLGDWRDAPTLFAASVAAHPGGCYAPSQLGSLAAEANRLDEADEWLARARAACPRDWRTLTATCFLRLRQGRDDEAEVTCREATARNPTNPRAWANLATAYVHRGAWPPALAAAERALEVKPRYAEAHFLAALAAANLGDLPNAAAQVGAALAIDPAHRGANDLAAQLRRRGVAF